jgi:hypothetical protein
MRTLWFVAGTAAGVYATTQARRAVEALTVDGVHDRLTGWFAGAAVLREELRAGMQEKEDELRDRLQLAPPRRTAITTGRAADPAAAHVAPVRRLHAAPAVDGTDAPS